MTAQDFFSERLRNVANEKRLDQKYFVEKMNLPKSTVNSWFTGRAFPRLEPMIQLADLLGCSIDWLLGRSDSPKIRKPRKADPA
jgi:transcriptional regulator with XRE-family HTH domain